MNRLSTKSVVRHSLLALAASASLFAIAGNAVAADQRGLERAREAQQERLQGQQASPPPQAPRGEAPRQPPRIAPPPQAQGGGGG
ncbi:MAG: hypothetical protein ABW136_11785, partial [Steroidobacteraceae bacterium]